MTRNVVLAATVLLGTFSFAATTAAQEDALAELYGRGVHAYFANNYEAAHELLTQAIDDGSKDPRCYFFRGLSHAMTGRPEEAKADFKKGAQLESTATDRAYDVSRALQRVQGSIRLEIEEFRQKAKLDARALAARRARARYEQFQRAQEDVVLPNEPRSAGGSGIRSGGGGEGAPTVDDPFSEKTPAATRPDDAADAAEGTTNEGTEPSNPFDTSPPQSDPFNRAPAPPGGAAPQDPFAPPTEDENASEAAPAEAAPNDDQEDSAAPTADDAAGAATDDAAPAEAAPNAGGGRRKGALGGLGRAFLGALPDLPQPSMPSIPGLGGPSAPPAQIPSEDDASTDPFDDNKPPTQEKPETPEAPPTDDSDPFGNP